MKRKLERINGLVLCAVIAILLTGTFLCVHKLWNMDYNSYDNEIRLEVSDTLLSIEQENYVDAIYPYIVLDLSGNIIVSKSKEYQVGSTANVNEFLTRDKSYVNNYGGQEACFTLTKENTTYGFVVFFVPESTNQKQVQEGKKALIPLAVSIFLSIALTIFYMAYARRNIYRPVCEISNSAKAIIAGNYDQEVVRVYGQKLQENEVGDLIYSFELMRDELKEKQMKEKELQKASKELISCISHDLRTPLSTIKAYAEGLRDGLARDEDTRNEYVGVILKKTNLLVSMIKELLEYSNAQASRMEFHKREMYLYEYINPVIQELQGFLENKQVEFTVAITASNVLLKMDSKRITEVLYNLVENSKKYMDKEPAKIALTVKDYKDSVLFSIKDNGMGIASDDILYVFDKFYRAEKSRSSTIPGSGLGLSICQYIVQEHGGEISCSSHVGKDCEISFTLPIN
ncbi:MAG: HAMP domain-containing sensor histidine kinase [bacterium]|nr:HAMP domain-containing sensor histidine kinase [bacterium]